MLSNRKYLLVINVRTAKGLSSDVFYFDTPNDAEINFYSKVSEAIQNENIVLAHYIVVNEQGVKLGNLERIIDNQEIEIPINESLFNIEQ